MTKEMKKLEMFEYDFEEACKKQNIAEMALYGGKCIMYSKCLAIETEDKKELTQLGNIESNFIHACYQQNIPEMALYGGQYIMYSKCLTIEAEGDKNGSSKG